MATGQWGDGRFRPGPDDRRHLFTPAECRRGYQAASAKGAETAAWVFRKVRKSYGRRHKAGYGPRRKAAG